VRQWNKANDNDWFTIASDKSGTKWTGKCWCARSRAAALCSLNTSRDGLAAARCALRRYIHNLLKYEFALQFEIPVTYPATAPEIELPELDGVRARAAPCVRTRCGLTLRIRRRYCAGKTAKMYRGGKICLTIHFKPLWAKNAPHFGVAHALCLGLAPWLAAEVPHLVESGAIRHKDDMAKPAAA
jgi:ufm1-conjugating enzyme 1